MRTLEELVNDADSAFPLVREWAAASGSCEILPPPQDRDRVLIGLQVTTRSPMGAIAYESGGLLIDHGWLRVLGAGHPKLDRNLLDWNENRSSGFLLVADDVAGGFFAINGGYFGEDKGATYYWAPDTLAWQSLELGYGDFLRWALSDRLEAFYGDLRWPGWESDTQALDGRQCFNFYPFLWAKEGSVEQSSRRAISVAEQYAFNLDQARQIR